MIQFFIILYIFFVVLLSFFLDEKVDDEEQKEKDISTELKDMDYSSSRDKVIDEKINKKYEEAELEEEYNNPDYNT